MSQHVIENAESQTQSQFQLKSFNPIDFNAQEDVFVKISNKIKNSINQLHPRAIRAGILANYKMNETDYVSGTSATLQQEMHLARRACWNANSSNSNSNINNNNNNKPKRNASTKDTQCCDVHKSDDELELANFNINKANTKTKTKTKIKTKTINENEIKNERKRKINVATNVIDNERRNDDDNENDNDDDNDYDDNEHCGIGNIENIKNIETVLYGANVNEKNPETKAFPEDEINSNNDKRPPSANILMNKFNVNNIMKHEFKTQVPNSLVNEIQTTTNNDRIQMNKKNSNFKNNDDIRIIDLNFRERLFKFWFAFVTFCDSITIKSNYSNFDNTNEKSSEIMKQFNRPKSQEDEKQTNAIMTSKLRLFKNKKLIFLFLICGFFAFLDRIDARPNASVINNLASDATINSNGQMDRLPEVAKLTLATNPTESILAALPLASNMIPKKQLAESSPIQEETRHVILSSPDDDEVPHPDRYPVSQVDFDRVKTPFIIGIWILSASIAKIGFHMTPKLHLIFPESCLLIVVGVVIGVVLYLGTNVAVSPLTPNTFFFYMLPPIILDAGYFMPNRLFFDNLGTILLMAVVGTIFNIATIGGALWACGVGGIYGDQAPKLLDIFLFASLISAVDPVAVLAVFEEIHVNEILYIVVFGESLLNDAVTVVMYHMMEVYNEIGISKIIAQDLISGVGSFFIVAIGGTVIGIIWGFLTGLVTRFTDHVRVIEPIFIFVMAYLAYLNAEIFHMSGILAITFCGITMKNYVESNISQKSHTTVKYALKMLSSSSETIIFMFLGVATVNNNHVWNTWFVILTIVFCSVFRVLGVILLTAIANRFRLHKLSRVDQFVMSYGGLRGAVAFALVLLVDERVVKDKNMFVTTTIAVIYFTVFIQGITIKPLVKFLNVKRANKRKPTMNERIHERFMDHLMAGIEDIVGKTGNYNVRDKFKRFDNRFIRPLLIRDLKQGAEPKIMETYSKLTMRDAMEVMRRNPSTIGQISGTESMSALFRNYTNNCIGGRWAPPTIYTTCPSLTNLDNTCSRNLDMHELDYNPSKKDLTDAKIHHLLAEELKPYRRASQQMHRRLSYSRHAVDDRDLSTQVNYKMQMNFRRMFNDRKHHKRSKRGSSKQPETVKQNHVSFHDFQQNGSTKQFSHDYINEVLNESADENQMKPTDANTPGGNDDWDDGLTFTAKSSPDSDRANNNSLIAHIQNLPGFDASKARIVQHYSTASKLDDENSAELLSPENIGPTAAELILPWRRDRSYPNIVAEYPIPEEDRTLHCRDSDGERRVSTPTAMESQLPWKRQGDEITVAVQQNEFPAWASNKEYLAYNSPSATFLGGINKPKQPKSVIGLFRRESCGSKGGAGGGSINEVSAGSDPALAAALAINISVPSTTATMHNPRLDKRSLSISVSSGVSGTNDTAHSGPFAVTASHRRNVRRGSMLELTGLLLTGRRPSKLLNFSPISRKTTNFNTTNNSPSISTNTTTTTSPSNNTTATTSTATITTINDNDINKIDFTYINNERQVDNHHLDEEDTIPEETQPHAHSKSLCEPADDDDNDWNITIGAGATGLRHDRINSGSSNVSSDRLLRSGREPLLPRLTPRSQIKRGMSAPGPRSHVTTALLSTSNSDFDDDEIEDFELYDDENIVVTTLTTTSGNRSGNNGTNQNVNNTGNTGTNTTTTIRLTRNNDESII